MTRSDTSIQPLSSPSGSLPAPNLPTCSRARGGLEPGVRPLPTRFSRGEFTCRQIAREGMWAIYEQTWNGTRDAAPCYEVIRIRCSPARQIAGVTLAPAEMYPPSESWGKYGFTLTDKDAAFAKLRELTGGNPT
jgi:hypothetical protein